MTAAPALSPNRFDPSLSNRAGRIERGMQLSGCISFSLPSRPSAKESGRDTFPS
jgi:hypothetical protein